MMPQSRKQRKSPLFPLFQRLWLLVSSVFLFTAGRRENTTLVAKEEGRVEEYFKNYNTTDSLQYFDKTTFVLSEKELAFTTTLQARLMAYDSSFKGLINPFFISISQFGRIDIQCYLYADAVNYKMTMLGSNQTYLTVLDRVDVDVFSHSKKNLRSIIRHISNGLTQALSSNGVRTFPDVRDGLLNSWGKNSTDIFVQHYSDVDTKILQGCKKNIDELDIMKENVDAGGKFEFEDIHLDIVSCFQLTNLLCHSSSFVGNSTYRNTSNDIFNYSRLYLNTLQENRGFSQLDVALLSKEFGRISQDNTTNQPRELTLLMLSLLRVSIGGYNAIPAAYAVTTLNLLTKLDRNIKLELTEKNRVFVNAELAIKRLFMVAKSMASIDVELDEISSRALLGWMSFCHFMRFISYLPPFQRRNHNLDTSIHENLKFAFGARYILNKSDPDATHGLVTTSRILAADDSVENQFMIMENTTKDNWYLGLYARLIKTSPHSPDANSMRSIINRKKCELLSPLYPLGGAQQYWDERLLNGLLPSVYREKRRIPRVVSVSIASLELYFSIFLTRLPKSIVVVTDAEEKVINVNFPITKKSWSDKVSMIKLLLPFVRDYIIHCVNRASPPIAAYYLNPDILNELDITALTKTEYKMSKKCQRRLSVYDMSKAKNIAQACSLLMEKLFTTGLIENVKKITEYPQYVYYPVKQYIDRHVINTPFKSLYANSWFSEHLLLSHRDEEKYCGPLSLGLPDKFKKYIGLSVMEAFIFSALEDILNQKIKNKDYDYRYAECLLMYVTHYMDANRLFSMMTFLDADTTKYTANVLVTWAETLVHELDWVGRSFSDLSDINSRDFQNMFTFVNRLMATVIRPSRWKLHRVFEGSGMNQYVTQSHSIPATDFYLRSAHFDNPANIVRTMLEILLDKRNDWDQEQLNALFLHLKMKVYSFHLHELPGDYLTKESSFVNFFDKKLQQFKRGGLTKKQIAPLLRKQVFQNRSSLIFQIHKAVNPNSRFDLMPEFHKLMKLSYYYCLYAAVPPIYHIFMDQGTINRMKAAPSALLALVTIYLLSQYMYVSNCRNSDIEALQGETTTQPTFQPRRARRRAAVLETQNSAPSIHGCLSELRLFSAKHNKNFFPSDVLQYNKRKVSPLYLKDLKIHFWRNCTVDFRNILEGVDKRLHMLRGGMTMKSYLIKWGRRGNHADFLRGYQELFSAVMKLMDAQPEKCSKENLVDAIEKISTLSNTLFSGIPSTLMPSNVSAAEIDKHITLAKKVLDNLQWGKGSDRSRYISVEMI